MQLEIPCQRWHERREFWSRSFWGDRKLPESFVQRGIARQRNSRGKGMRACHVLGAHLVPRAAETRVFILPVDMALTSCPRGPFVPVLYSSSVSSRTFLPHITFPAAFIQQLVEH